MTLKVLKTGFHSLSMQTLSPEFRIWSSARLTFETDNPLHQPTELGKSTKPPHRNDTIKSTSHLVFLNSCNKETVSNDSK